MPAKGLLRLPSLWLLPPVAVKGTEVMVKRKEIIWSVVDLWKARARMKKRRTERLPTTEDLPALEEEARKEMERAKRELGVG